MLQQYKKIQIPVFLLLLAALAMQGMGPLFTASIGHHEEPMQCTLASGCSSCSVDGHSNSKCNCNHHSEDTHSRQENSGAKVCGCTHHGNRTLGVALPSQVKAVMDMYLIPSPKMNTSLTVSGAFPDYQVPVNDIFHPPRPIA